MNWICVHVQCFLYIHVSQSYGQLASIGSLPEKHSTISLSFAHSSKSKSSSGFWWGNSSAWESYCYSEDWPNRSPCQRVHVLLQAKLDQPSSGKVFALLGPCPVILPKKVPLQNQMPKMSSQIPDRWCIEILSGGRRVLLILKQRTHTDPTTRKQWLFPNEHLLLSMETRNAHCSNSITVTASTGGWPHWCSAV